MSGEQLKAEASRKAYDELAKSLRGFRLQELRWDWGCNISAEAKRMIEAEVARRGIDMQRFQLVKGARRNI